MGNSTTTVIPVTIANGTSVSGAINLEGMEVVGMSTPAAWTAAALSFEATDNPRSGEAAAYGTGTYRQITDDDGGGIPQIATAQMATADVILVRDTILNKLKGFQHIRLRSGTTAAAVNQGAARTFYLIVQNQP